MDELAVNTIRHTRSGHPGGKFVVEVRRQQESHGETETKSERVIIWVRDEGGPHEPAIPPTADEYAECGRGLLTLASTAESWGWFGDPSGRTICAVFTDSLKNVRP